MAVTVKEFKRRLDDYIADEGCNNAADLLTDWDGSSAIDNDAVNEYNCSLGSVSLILDEIGIDSELMGYGSYGGMYIKICVVFP